MADMFSPSEKEVAEAETNWTLRVSSLVFRIKIGITEKV